MSLRGKLALGFGGLLAIIIAIGVHNITRITELGQSIDVILRENYRSVLACEEMKDALNGLDGGAALALLGAGEKGGAEIARNEARFEKALDIELHNITLPGEGEKAALLKELFARYRAAVKAIGRPVAGSDVGRRAYLGELRPLFQQIKDTADEILRMNQKNMVDQDARARRQASLVLRQMSLMFIAATFVVAVFLYLTGKWILRPITRLTASANEIRKGNLDVALTSASRDEIGRLSEAFNEMAAGLREFRRTDQARLMRIERSTRQAFDSLPDTIAVLDPDGRVEVATESAREAFGLRPNAAIRDLTFPWMTGLFEEALTKGRPAELGEPQAVVQHFFRGEERFYRPRAVPIRDAEKEPAGIVLVFQDVTQQRRQDEMKSGVIATVSHELKTPLTSIRMAIHLLLEEKVGALSPGQSDLLVAAREDADRLDTIVQDLLDIGRIESGKVRMDLRPLSVREMILEAIEPYRSAARDQGVTLAAELPEPLPRVWADPTRIAHVFANLLSNALKYTLPGGKILLSAQAGEGGVRFRVSDTGIGIPARFLPRIFEQFFRVPDQGPGTGAGLGLAIVKEIVEAHGGTVGVESGEGAGSTFSFSLRRADQPFKEGGPR